MCVNRGGITGAMGVSTSPTLEQQRDALISADPHSRVDSLTTLTGSQRQVDWARDILASLYTAVNNIARKGFNLAGMQVEADAQIQVHLEAARYLREMLDAMTPQLTSAKTVIDARSFLSMQTISSMGARLERNPAAMTQHAPDVVASQMLARVQLLAARSAP